MLFAISSARGIPKIRFVEVHERFHAVAMSVAGVLNGFYELRESVLDFVRPRFMDILFPHPTILERHSGCKRVGRGAKIPAFVVRLDGGDVCACAVQGMQKIQTPAVAEGAAIAVPFFGRQRNEPRKRFAYVATETCFKTGIPACVPDKRTA